MTYIQISPKRCAPQFRWAMKEKTLIRVLRRFCDNGQKREELDLKTDLARLSHLFGVWEAYMCVPVCGHIMH